VWYCGVETARYARVTEVAQQYTTSTRFRVEVLGRELDSADLD
jgi:hypothetical protein